MGWGVGGCVNVPGTCVLKMMLRRYATARCLGTCVMSPWGEGWAGALTYLALASWRWCYAATLQHVVLELASCHHGVRGGALTYLALASWRWCYATARCLGTCVNLSHVTMGWGVGGCVNVPGTCALKMMLRRYATARCPGTCVMTPWGEGWAGALTYLALASWRWCYAATLQHVVLELASCHHGVRGGRVR